MEYGYDGSSRLLTVEKSDFEAEYQYETGSSRLEEVIFRHDATLAAKTQREFDSKGRLETIATRRESDGQIFSRHAYSYNELDQRTEAVLEDGAKWEYDYDMFGQVIEGGKRNAAGTPVPGRQFAYDFDSIGNRIDTTTNGRVAAYTANKLNQYTQRQVPGAVDVSGLADPGATVTVNSEPSARQLDYFHCAATLNNSAGPVYAELKTEATKGGLTAEEIGFEYVPGNPESFTYAALAQSRPAMRGDLKGDGPKGGNADGNLLSDGRYNYEWDAENRLVALESVSAAPVLSRKKAEYSYDPQGRRISRKVWEWSAVSNQYELTENLRYLYHGWNLVAEINAGNDMVRTHLWGVDLSASLQEAGGVGGLLATTSHGMIIEIWFPAYDGNGNVTRMIHAEEVEAHAVFEYDPFGRQLRATGPALMHVPFRFSTKYWDFETGFSYYGYRYYNPETGRWLNRDPIEEEGGLNVYGFLRNNSINELDLFGLMERPQKRKFWIEDKSKRQVTGEWEVYSVSWTNVDSAGLAGDIQVRTIKVKYQADGTTECLCPEGSREPGEGTLQKDKEITFRPSLLGEFVGRTAGSVPLPPTGPILQGGKVVASAINQSVSAALERPAIIYPKQLQEMEMRISNSTPEDVSKAEWKEDPCNEN